MTKNKCTNFFVAAAAALSLAVYLFSHFELGYGNNYSCRRLAVHHGDGQALVARSLRFNEALELGRL